MLEKIMSLPIKIYEKTKRNLLAPMRSLHAVIRPSLCKLCGGKTKIAFGYGRPFSICKTCGFIFACDCNIEELEKGMGMEGSWTGPGGGGYREYYLVKMLLKERGMTSFLLYGTGNTPTFRTLKEEGINVIGCDISRDVVEHVNKLYGERCFFTPENLPIEKKYDCIAAVEVFEHLWDPHYYFNLLISRLNEGGLICGTTNFHPGGPLEDTNKPGYMSIKSHVVYWSNSSMSYMVAKYGLSFSAFEMVRPGSVLPDEKYGQLFPNKRVFFIYDPKYHGEYFEKLKTSTPILPIDKP